MSGGGSSLQYRLRALGWRASSGKAGRVVGKLCDSSYTRRGLIGGATGAAAAGVLGGLVRAGDAPARVPTGVAFDTSTLRRTDGRGDNWCMTWAADGDQVTAMCDGNWLGGPRGFRSRLYRVAGDAANFTRTDMAGFPYYEPRGRFPGSWYTYGVVDVDGVLYAALSKTPKGRWSGPFFGLKLLRSHDGGRTWYRCDRHGSLRKLSPYDEARGATNEAEMFFLREEGRTRNAVEAYPFAYLDFVQCGRGSEASQDRYVYMYSPEGAQSNLLNLARAPRSRLEQRAAWSYFSGWQSGAPTWSADLTERAPVHEFPSRSADGDVFGWYSWLPSVVFNPASGSTSWSMAAPMAARI